MTGSDTDEALARLYRDLNHKWLNPWWAKFEICLGLLGVAVGFVGGTVLARRPENEVPEWAWFGPIILIVLGGYLALAGHRSHLYQSNNRLAAYLAGLIRTTTPEARS